MKKQKKEKRKKTCETKCQLHVITFVVNMHKQNPSNCIRHKTSKNQKLVPLLNSRRITTGTPIVSPLFIVGAGYNPSDAVAVFHPDPILIWLAWLLTC